MQNRFAMELFVRHYETACQIIAGFGQNGEGYFRLTSFGSRENTIEAMRRFKEIFE